MMITLYVHNIYIRVTTCFKELRNLIVNFETQKLKICRRDLLKILYLTCTINALATKLIASKNLG